MTSLKQMTIFSKRPMANSIQSDAYYENKRVNYWLEKLYKQGEMVNEATPRNRVEDRSHTQGQNFEETSMKQSGINQHNKNISVKNESDRQKLNDLVRKSNRLIISISSVFPWDLFPNTIEVEESRVTFRFSQFLSSQSHSVNIKDISNVFIESSMFFSTLQVVSRTYVQNDIKIGNLKKREAKEVQRIIEGLRTFSENKINTSNYEIDELVAKINELHQARSV